eukprot:TRINITY_DN3228_c0_g1_i2.p2 TRINITY_DN3228_c0_g1~~TRINITY_DN3228_c0_g1_i2.p2  ORF type:complete len:196 (+),score=-10.62 TRINITY_DN3228_c0_g1_i2:1013-1600(+)
MILFRIIEGKNCIIVCINWSSIKFAIYVQIFPYTNIQKTYLMQQKLSLFNPKFMILFRMIEGKNCIVVYIKSASTKFQTNLQICTCTIFFQCLNIFYPLNAVKKNYLSCDINNFRKIVYCIYVSTCLQLVCLCFNWQSLVHVYTQKLLVVFFLAFELPVFKIIIHIVVSCFFRSLLQIYQKSNLDKIWVSNFFSH